MLTASGIVVKSIREQAELRALVKRAIAGNVANKVVANGGAMEVSRPGKRPLQLIATPVPVGMIEPTSRVALVLCISDPDRRSKMPADLLRELFKLTPAESRLTLSLLSGQSLQEIVDQFRIGRETARSQLKSVFQKTGTRRQVELIQLLTNMSSLLRSK